MFKMEIFKFSMGQIISLFFLIIFLIGILLQNWLNLSRNKEQGQPLTNLMSYTSLFKEGWKIFCRESWIFWIFLIFAVFAGLQNELPRYFAFKSSASGFLPPFTVPKIPIGAFLGNLRIYSLIALFRTLFKFDVLDLHLGSIVFCSLIFITIPKIKKIIFYENFPGQGFLKGNYYSFLFVNLCLLIYYITLSFKPEIHKYSFYLRHPLFFLTYLYWGVVVISFVKAIVFSVFKKSALRKEIKRGKIIAFALKQYFKPLFFFNAILAVFVFLVFNLQIFIHHPTHSDIFWSTRIGCLFFLPYLSIFLIPFLIVNENLDFNTAFRNNFQVWRRNSAQVVTLLFLTITIMWIVNYLPFLLLNFNFMYGSYFLDTIATFLKVFISFWLSAVFVLFCIKIRKENIEV